MPFWREWRLPRKIHDNRLNLRKGGSNSWGKSIREKSLNALQQLRRYNCPCDAERTVLFVVENFTVAPMRQQSVSNVSATDSHRPTRIALMPNHVHASLNNFSEPYPFQQAPLTTPTCYPLN
jgi:hypothetical protein